VPVGLFQINCLIILDTQILALKYSVYQVLVQVFMEVWKPNTGCLLLYHKHGTPILTRQASMLSHCYDLNLFHDFFVVFIAYNGSYVLNNLITSQKKLGVLRQIWAWLNLSNFISIVQHFTDSCLFVFFRIWLSAVLTFIKHTDIYSIMFKKHLNKEVYYQTVIIKSGNSTSLLISELVFENLSLIFEHDNYWPIINRYSLVDLMSFTHTVVKKDTFYHSKFVNKRAW
jgi:hypothetical protein